MPCAERQCRTRHCVPRGCTRRATRGAGRAPVGREERGAVGADECRGYVARRPGRTTAGGAGADCPTDRARCPLHRPPPRPPAAPNRGRWTSPWFRRRRQRIEARRGRGRSRAHLMRGVLRGSRSHCSRAVPVGGAGLPGSGPPGQRAWVSGRGRELAARSGPPRCTRRDGALLRFLRPSTRIRGGCERTRGNCWRRRR